MNVHFAFPGEPGLLILPEQALLFRAQGMQVAVLDDQDRVHLQDIALGHNLDTDVQIVSGLKATDRVVANPSLGLLEGQPVKVVQPVHGYQPGDSATSARAPMQLFLGPAMPAVAAGGAQLAGSESRSAPDAGSGR